MSPAGKWMDQNAGPVVRPYALTGGRTGQASGEVLDLITLVVAQAEPADDSMELSPEDRRILGLCRQPVTVSDVAAATGLPLGVVRVLLADLIQRRLIRALPSRYRGAQPSSDLLREVLHGLRAL